MVGVSEIAGKTLFLGGVCRWRKEKKIIIN